MHINLENYNSALNRKIKNFKILLSKHDFPTPKIFPSPIKNFRMRAEFRIWHDDGVAKYAMNYPGQKKVYFLEEFPIASLIINKTMNPLIKMINNCLALKEKLFSVEFLSSGQNKILITLIYHKPLNNDWSLSAERVRRELGVSIIGRSRKKKIVLGDSFVEENIKVKDHSFVFRQPEGCFTQPNLKINKDIMSWLMEIIPNSAKKLDVIELYCGIGNFTMPLSKKFKNVLATEVSKLALETAKENQKLNKINNIKFARLSSKETQEALFGTRNFRRLEGIEIKKYDFNYVVIDPPRSGLDPDTLNLVVNIKNVIYISCNPKSLLEDLEHILKTHKIINLAVFDQFPWTEHLEVGALMESHTKVQ